MYLKRIRQLNPALVRAATTLHQAGEIPPNTFVFDADTFERNGRLIREAAEKHGLRLYFMTKQHGRSPELFRRVVRVGSRETVAVNAEDARILHRHGFGLGHIGNLVQPPRAELTKVILTYRPEVISVFSVRKAAQISSVAETYGLRQAILLRVHSHEDTLFPGMEGGFYLEDLPDVVREIAAFPGVEITGVTTFPALKYDAQGPDPVATRNLDSLVRARDILTGLGIEIRQVNAPGNNACNTMAFLAERGVTHVEPGAALTGSSTYHLYDDNLPESPAMVYVTEVAHIWDSRIYVFGGGFFIDDPPVPMRAGFQRRALIGSSAESILDQEIEWEGIGARGGGSFAAIDYHGILALTSQHADVGDTVIFGFRPQLFMTRAYAAVIEGIRTERYRLVGIWDWAGHRVGGGME